MNTLLNYVKNSMGITGEYQDQILLNYINDIKFYMLDAGVSQAVIDDEASYGAIARGVADLWNYGAGDGQLSPWFYQRVTQLCYAKIDV